MTYLEPCKIERYPCWHIQRVVSDDLLPTTDDTFVMQGQTLYTVDIGLPGLYVVMNRKEQNEIKTCLAYERSR